MPSGLFLWQCNQAEMQTNGKTSSEKRMAGQRLERTARVQEQGGPQVCWHSGAIYQVYGLPAKQSVGYLEGMGPLTCSCEPRQLGR